MQIHHYTKIDTLALILENKTLRFTRLDLVDDRLEGDDFGNYNPLKYIFASSWTGEDKEQIPLWDMYASLDSGVRISISINEKLESVFKINPITFRNILPSFYTANQDIDRQIDIALKSSDSFLDIPVKTTFLRPEQSHNRDYVVIPQDSDIQIADIIYRDDFLSLYRNSVRFENGIYTINGHNNFGKYKTTYWEFQKEKRFLIHTIPACGIERNMTSRGYSNIDIETKYIDVDFCEDVIDNMIITFAPNVKESQKELIKNLIINRPSIQIRNSILANKLRKKTSS